MKTNETLKCIDNKEFIDMIYHFSYHRCNTSSEAEELCSEIILAIISSVRKQDSIDNFYAYVWTIARRVYADYCKKQNNEHQITSIENENMMIAATKNEIDILMEAHEEKEQLKNIFKEISFLSKAYREVMIMYYIDGLKISDIAGKLHISETTVKQRLFSARNSVRKEVNTMNERNYLLKPIKLAFFGTGSPVGNDPREKAERSLSQNLVYLCKSKPKSAKELSEELCIPMPYIEEELEIQCRGENGEYGLLKKLDNGKYTINIHLVDYEEYDLANRIYEKHLPAFCDKLKTYLKKNEKKILSFPYLNKQKDLHFILWALISRMIWGFECKINDILKEKHFADITPVKRDFTCVAIAYTDDQHPAFNFYGCDDIDATSISGYKWVLASNIYGDRIEKHFECGHNFSRDEKLLMTLQSIGGISVNKLTESEKEVASKAIECGYLRKNGDTIEPDIIVISQKDLIAFYDFAYAFNDDTMDISEQIADELAAFMKKHIPEHLMNEYPVYTSLIAGIRILSNAIEECISEGLLIPPANRTGAEGILMAVQK